MLQIVLSGWAGVPPSSVDAAGPQPAGVGGSFRCAGPGCGGTRERIVGPRMANELRGGYLLTPVAATATAGQDSTPTREQAAGRPGPVPGPPPSRYRDLLAHGYSPRKHCRASSLSTYRSNFVVSFHLRAIAALSPICAQASMPSWKFATLRPDLATILEAWAPESAASGTRKAAATKPA